MFWFNNQALLSNHIQIRKLVLLFSNYPIQILIRNKECSLILLWVYNNHHTKRNYHSFEDLDSFKGCPFHLKPIILMLLILPMLFLYYFWRLQFILLKLAIIINSYYRRQLYSSDFLNELLFLPLSLNILPICFPNEYKEVRTALHQ